MSFECVLCNLYRRSYGDPEITQRFESDDAFMMHLVQRHPTMRLPTPGSDVWLFLTGRRANRTLLDLYRAERLALDAANQLKIASLKKRASTTPREGAE